MKKEPSLNIHTRDKFRQLIVQKTGLEIREQNLGSFDNIIINRTRKLRFDEPENYFIFLSLHCHDSQKEWEELVLELTNNESYFFRDQGQFKLLEEHILPELIKRKKITKSLRICSAGYSTGPEPYSLAILLKELIPDIQTWNLLILGVDINHEVLEVARKGVYSPWSFRRVAPEIKEKYFTKKGEQYQINNDIKKLLKFEVCNLVENEQNSKKSDFLDIVLIVCRNVFIYFSQKTIKKILNIFYNKLQPSGYLLTGHSEIISQNSGLIKFKKKLFAQSLIYQKPKLDEVIKTTTLLANQKSLYPVNQVVKNTKKSGLDVIPKPSKNISKRNINLLEVKPKNKEISSPEIDHLKEIEDIKMLLQKRSYNLVTQKLINILDKFHNDLNYLSFLAETYANIGKYEQAIKHCNHALDVDNLSFKFYYLLVDVYQEKKEDELTKRILDKIIYLNANSVYGYFKLGNFYQDRGNAKKAKKMYHNTLKILDTLPNNQQIAELNDLSVEELSIKLSNLVN